MPQEIDIRDIDRDRRDATVESVVAAAVAIAGRRRVRHSVEVINRDPPATCADEVRGLPPVFHAVALTSSNAMSYL